MIFSLSPTYREYVSGILRRRRYGTRYRKK